MQREGLAERFDPYFHQPRFRWLSETLISIGSAPLGSLVDYADEEWDKADGRFSDTFPYIEIGNVELGANEYAIERVDVGNAPSRARQVVRENDVLVSLTRPHRGAIARVLPEHDGAIASTGFAVIRGADNRRALVDYIMACLTASFGLDQMLMRSSGGTYPAITRDQLARVLIPNLEIDEQRRLADDMADARAERKAKLAEADALLAGLDDFVLSELGIDPPQEDNRRVFAVRLGDIGGRFDVRHHAVKETLRSSFPVVSLGDLTSVEPAYGSSQRAVPRTSVTQPRYIRITDFGDDGIETGHEYVTLDAPERKHELELNDVLFARTGSVGKTYLHEDASEPAIFAGYCIRFRFDPAKVLPEFVYWWSKTKAYARWVNAIQRPSVQANINKEEFKRCPIPLPSLERQREIVASVRSTRERARRLRGEAEAGWVAARAGFEVAVVG